MRIVLPFNVTDRKLCYGGNLPAKGGPRRVNALAAFLDPQRRLPLCEEHDAVVHHAKTSVLISGRPGFDERLIRLRHGVRTLWFLARQRLQLQKPCRVPKIAK
jgi:hypothetical protein